MKMNRNPTTEVHLRRRSTPYDFRVIMDSNESSLGLYDGRSYKSALDAYWQGVRTLHFLHQSGRVSLNLTMDKQPYGSFNTEFNHGRATSLHVPSGRCVEWADKRWIEGNIEEKMIATVPSTLGPIRH
jgi:hypothetical protein